MPRFMTLVHRLAIAYAIAAASAWAASAQPAQQPASPGIGYKTVAEALAALRAKSGVKVLDQAGWTVIDDRADSSIWSFPPAGHPAHPAAIRRIVFQQGKDIFIRMSVLCQAAKPACDRLVAEFEAMNKATRERLGGKSKSPG
jgi:hypothetical protein